MIDQKIAVAVVVVLVGFFFFLQKASIMRYEGYIEKSKLMGSIKSWREKKESERKLKADMTGL